MPSGEVEPLEIVETSFESGEFSSDPHRIYRVLREHAPVYWSAFLGQWLVTSAQSVDEVLRQPQIFSSFGYDAAYIGRLPTGTRCATLAHHFRQRGLIQADPPEHTRLRRVLSRHFAARALEPMRPSVERTVERLLDSVPPRLDVIRDFARPLPVDVIANLLGVPETDRGRFPGWSASAVRFFGSPQPNPQHAEALDEDLVAWRSLLFGLFEDRRSVDRGDLLGVIARHVCDDDISLEEALFTAVHLLIAGHETTTSLIGNAIHLLVTHPEHLGSVLRDLVGVETAIEEVLRFEPPIHRVRRLTTAEYELEGAVIHPGEAVIPILAAANRDPLRFQDPEVFDPHRDPAQAPAWSFGRGVHFCLGAHLAKLEAGIAIDSFFRRFAKVELPKDFTPEWNPTINLRGLSTLPLLTEEMPGVAR